VQKAPGVTKPDTRPDGAVVCVVADGEVADTVVTVDETVGETTGKVPTGVAGHFAKPEATALRSVASIESPHRAFTATHEAR
jgi:hypothetical protein